MTKFAGLLEFPRRDGRLLLIQLQDLILSYTAAMRTAIQRVSEYAPRLEKVLTASKATIPVADAIDAPLHQAAIEIINNPAMTDWEGLCLF